MAKYFECLHCGLISPVGATPPKCGRCGHGTGVIHLKKPDKFDKQSAEGRHGNGGDDAANSNEPAGMRTAAEDTPPS